MNLENKILGNKMFLGDVKETMMTAKYETKMVHVTAGIITTTNAGLGMKVKVTDPDGKLLMDRMYGHKGMFSSQFWIFLKLN